MMHKRGAEDNDRAIRGLQMNKRNRATKVALASMVRNVAKKRALPLVLVAVLVAAQLSGILPAVSALAEDAVAGAMQQSEPLAAEQSSAGELSAGESSAEQQPVTEEQPAAEKQSLMNTTGTSEEVPGDDTTKPNEPDASEEVSHEDSSESAADKPEEDAALEPLSAKGEEVEGEEISPLAGEITTQEELETALAAAAPGDTVTLTQSVELNRKLTVPINKAFILDGGGNSLTLAAGYTGRHIESASSSQAFAANVGFQNLTFAGGGVGGGVVFFGKSAVTLSVSNCTFTAMVASGSGGGLSLSGGCTAIISNSTFTDNTASLGSAINIDENMKTTITGSTFTGNAGSAIYTYNNTDLALIDSHFTNNSGAQGGALRSNVYNQNQPYVVTVTASDCTFTNNAATGIMTPARALVSSIE